MISLLTLLLAFTGTVLLTHYYIQQLANNGPVALPNHRTMHVGAVPVGGGLPLIVTAVITALVLWPIAAGYALLLPTLAVLAAVSWFDDVSGVTPIVRFSVHSAAAIACLLLLPGDATVFQGMLPVWLDRVITGIAIVWFINLFNFMDGIDGIAGAETIAIASGYALVTMWQAETPPLHGLALALVGASLGFLFWNWAPARIFMGDVGAVPIGFALAVLLVDLAVRQSLAAALILPLYFAADATLTLARRLKHGEKPWEAHRWHWYQRAARELGSHAQVVCRISLVNVGLIALALLSLTAPWLAFTCAVALVGGLLYHLENTAGDTPITEV